MTFLHGYILGVVSAIAMKIPRAVVEQNGKEVWESERFTSDKT